MLFGFFGGFLLFSTGELVTLGCFLGVAIFLLATGGRAARGYTAGVASCPIVFLVLGTIAAVVSRSQDPNYYAFLRILTVTCAVTTCIVCYTIAMLKTEQKATDTTE